MSISAPALPPRSIATDDLAVLLGELGDRGAPRFRALVDVAAHESPAVFVAETVHFLTMLHAELPSVLDHAAITHSADWLDAAAAALHRERAWLTALSVETGPRVDLAGLTQAEHAVRALRDAMLTLVGSAREGCALGVAAAFVQEWPVIADALDDAGSRLFAPRWPEHGHIWPASAAEQARRELLTRADSRPVRFGAVQYASLHGQLFDLLAARARQPRG